MKNEQILTLLQYKHDDTWQHVKIINQEICQKCKNKECITACPAWVFKEDEVGSIEVCYKQCIECGICRLVCPDVNIDFDYPHGGFGVIYREG